jgi:ElaB/YqjD/DUF883 family membrane-anchored ribosome-binding protein
MKNQESSSQEGPGMNEVSSDLAALRADVARLTETMTTIAQNQVGSTSQALSETMESARAVLSEATETLTRTGRDLANEATGRIRTAGTEMGASIERHPLTAVMIAAAIGLAVGMLGRDRR